MISNNGSSFLNKNTDKLINYQFSNTEGTTDPNMNIYNLIILPV